MAQLFGTLGTLFDLALVILGFGFIVFIHELGHFLAARWAGIRVLAFAVGFGPAAVSYRKGMGFRRGSSEREYLAKMSAEAAGATTIEGTRATYHAMSPTEYRLNWLPFGGYVKMLGQDDSDPTAVSDAPDGYQRCKPWKRMVVISAGVVMNLILAATLFVGVFMYGIMMEPAKVGSVAPASAASRAVCIGGAAGPGLKPGDEITSINGRTPNSFNDLILATAMTPREGTLRLTVKRPGAGTLDFAVTPERGTLTGLQEIGVSPARSARLGDVRTEAEREQFRELFAKRGLEGLEPGMTLVSVQGASVDSGGDLDEAVRRSRGEPVRAEFAGPDGKRAAVSLTPRAELQSGLVQVKGKGLPIAHLLGLNPVLCVGAGEAKQGLQEGDIFARLGSVEFPGVADGVAEIKANTGREIPVSVLRKGADGALTLVKIEPMPRVTSAGTIGFSIGTTAEDSTLLAMPPARIVDSVHAAPGAAPAAESIIRRSGMRVLSVGGREVRNFSDLRGALLESTAAAYESSLGSARVRMVLAPAKINGAELGQGEPEQVDWEVTAQDLGALHALTWTSILSAEFFEPEQFRLQASGPVDAMRMGLSETQRVMLTTYITFARLFQGTVKVEHLKGPIGIAHLGTRVAEKGTVWLLFFMALISVNLAVVNFLPLPIVDGGQFLFLLVEQLRGKPVPVAIQNVATIAGLLLIGTMFVIVTFHDITHLFG